MKSKMLIKIALLLSAGAMLFFGVIDVVIKEFKKKANSSVISVGNIEIKEEDIQNEIQYLKDNIKYINSESERANDEKNHILLKKTATRNLIENALIEQEAEKINFVVTEEMINMQIQSNPAFQNHEKEFDQEKYQKIIGSNPEKEKYFIKKIRSELMQEQLKNIIRSTSNIAPNEFVELMLQVMYSTREISIYEFTANSYKGDEIKVNEKELEKFFISNKNLFDIPEKRVIQYTVISLDSIDPKEYYVNYDNVKEYYKKIKDHLFLEENRDIIHIPFSSKMGAMNAYNDLKNGSDINSIKKKYSKDIILKDGQSIDIKGVTEQNFSEYPEMKNFIFKSEVGSTLKPQKIFGDYWSLIYIVKINKKRAMTFEESYEQIYSKLEKDKKTEAVLNLAQKIEEDIEENKSLETISEERKLQLFQDEFIKDINAENNEDDKDFCLNFKNVRMYIKNDPEVINAVWNTSKEGNYEFVQLNQLNEHYFNCEKYKHQKEVISNIKSAAQNISDKIKLQTETNNDTKISTASLPYVIVFKLSNIINAKSRNFSECFNEIKKMYIYNTTLEKQKENAYKFRNFLNNEKIKNITSTEIKKNQNNSKNKEIDNIKQFAYIYNKNISRLNIDESIDQNIMSESLTIGENEVTKVYKCANGSFCFAKINKIKYLSDDTLQKMKVELNNQIADIYISILFDEYIANLMKKYNINF